MKTRHTSFGTTCGGMRRGTAGPRDCSPRVRQYLAPPPPPASALVCLRRAGLLPDRHSECLVKVPVLYCLNDMYFAVLVERVGLATASTTT